MEFTLYYAGFYTHFSFVLFIISLMLPFTSPIKFFLLLNSIVVGFIGNLLNIYYFETFVAWYRTAHPEWTDEEIHDRINLGNFISHTLPLFLALAFIPFCKSRIETKKDIVKYTILEFGLFMIWAVLPFENTIVQEKVNNSYPNTSFVMIATLTFCLFFFTLLFFLGRGLHSMY
jgi:uncharacterized membrane protein YidH (DUF202 family)